MIWSGDRIKKEDGGQLTFDNLSEFKWALFN